MVIAGGVVYNCPILLQCVWHHRSDQQLNAARDSTTNGQRDLHLPETIPQAGRLGVVTMKKIGVEKQYNL